MRPPARRVLGWGVAVAVTVAVVALSQVPWAEERTADAELRLAWRFTSERVRQCRKLTPEEQARLPAHMRRAEDCRRGLRPYRLQIGLDGGAVADDTVRPRGAESDRPLFVYRRLRLAPGSHAVRVAFTPVGGGTLALALDTVVGVAARRVALVTLDEDAGRLVVRTALP